MVSNIRALQAKDLVVWFNARKSIHCLQTQIPFDALFWYLEIHTFSFGNKIKLHSSNIIEAGKSVFGISVNYIL